MGCHVYGIKCPSTWSQVRGLEDESLHCCVSVLLRLQGRTTRRGQCLLQNLITSINNNSFDVVHFLFVVFGCISIASSLYCFS